MNNEFVKLVENTLNAINEAPQQNVFVANNIVDYISNPDLTKIITKPESIQALIAYLNAKTGKTFTSLDEVSAFYSELEWAGEIAISYTPEQADDGVNTPKMEFQDIDVHDEQAQIEVEFVGGNFSIVPEELQKPGANIFIKSLVMLASTDTTLHGEMEDQLRSDETNEKEYNADRQNDAERDRRNGI